MDLAQSIMNRRQLPHKYTIFDINYPMGNYAIKIGVKYYTLKSGLWTIDQARKLARDTKQLNPELYKYKAGMLIKYEQESSSRDIPEDILEHEISKYLDINDINKFRITSKQNLDSMKREMLAKQIKIQRQKLVYEDLYLLDEYDDEDTYIAEYLPLTVPKPKLKYGVPDLDFGGNPIQENIESNNEWQLLISMLKITQPPDPSDDETLKGYNLFEYKSEQEFWDLIKNYVDQIFEHILIQSKSLYIEYIVQKYPDPVRLINLIRNRDLDLAKNVYRYCHLLVNDIFLKTGYYSDIVNMNDETIDKFRTLQGYPVQYNKKLYNMCIDKLHQHDRSKDIIFDDYNKYLSTLEYDQAIKEQIFGSIYNYFFI